MHIHILSLLKVIVILYSIRQTQINQNLHIIQIIYMDTWIFHTDNQTLEPTLISHFSLFWPLGTECLATLLCFNSLGWVSNSMPHFPKLIRGSTPNNECQIGNKWSITGLELVNLSTLTLIGLVITNPFDLSSFNIVMCHTKMSHFICITLESAKTVRFLKT